MNRRKFLTLFAGVGIGASGVVMSDSDIGLGESISNVTEGLGDGLSNGDEGASMTQEFGPMSPGFEKIEFQRVIASNFDGYIATITFGSHSMDGFGIRHSSHDSVEKDTYVCSPPTSTGTREVPLVQLLEKAEVVYPNRKFNLVAYDGEFSDCDSKIKIALSSGVRGKATFTLPKEIAPPSAFRDLTPTG